LLSGASALFLIDRRAAAARLARAAAAGASDPDSVAAAQAQGHLAYAALRGTGYAETGFAASERAVARLRSADSAALLRRQLGRHAYYLTMRSRYGEAVAAAAEGASIALAAGDLFEYLLAEQFRCLALLHGGRLGEALAATTASEALAERNGHPLWVL